MVEHSPDGRDETPDERADRNWVELLQEFRVMQTGIQLLSGFLLTLPFQPRFAELDRFQHGTYLVLVVLAALSTSVVLSPVAVHRRLFGHRRKDRIVRVGHTMAKVAVALVATMVVGSTFFVFDIATSRPTALAVGGAVAAMVAVAVIVLPALLARHETRTGATASPDPSGRT